MSALFGAYKDSSKVSQVLLVWGASQQHMHSCNPMGKRHLHTVIFGIAKHCHCTDHPLLHLCSANLGLWTVIGGGGVWQSQPPWDEAL